MLFGVLDSASATTFMCGFLLKCCDSCQVSHPAGSAGRLFVPLALLRYEIQRSGEQPAEEWQEAGNMFSFGNASHYHSGSD